LTATPADSDSQKHSINSLQASAYSDDINTVVTGHGQSHRFTYSFQRSVKHFFLWKSHFYGSV